MKNQLARFSLFSYPCNGTSTVTSASVIFRSTLLITSHIQWRSHRKFGHLRYQAIIYIKTSDCLIGLVLRFYLNLYTWTTIIASNMSGILAWAIVTLSEYPTGSCILLVSSFFFFLLLATLLRLISQSCLDRFQPDLVTRTPWPCPNLSYNQLGVKGHVGVTGVKKVISLKTLLLLQITGYGHVTHVHASAWPLLQKLWV